MLATFTMEQAQEVVDGIPEDRRVVLLGESTHGTEEFYRQLKRLPVKLTLGSVAPSRMVQGLVGLLFVQETSAQDVVLMQFPLSLD